MSNYHLDKNALEQLAGKLDTIPELNADERAVLLALLRTAGVVFRRTLDDNPAIDLVRKRPAPNIAEALVTFSAPEGAKLQTLKSEFLRAFELENQPPSDVYDLQIGLGDGPGGVRGEGAPPGGRG